MAAKKPAKSKTKKLSEVSKSKTKSVTPVRNTALPKVTKKIYVPTEAEIAKRAFEIHCGGTGGSESDNWHRAERELRAGL